MKAFSQDLRERIIQTIQQNEETQDEIARHFKVSLSFLEKLWHRWRTSASCAAKPHAGGPVRQLKDQAATLRAAVTKQPDATLPELGAHVVAAQGPAVSNATLCRELQRLNLPLKKKSLHADERETPRVQKLRADFRELIAALKTGRFKFVDETGLNLAFTRLYGRAAPGLRVVDSVPGDHGGNHTLVAAVGLQGVSAPWLIEGALNGELFELWVREVLCLTLRRGDILFWDNLAAHKVAGVAALLKERGVRLIPLSPYSPDFNPIEKCWSKIKTFLRQAKARTVEALLEALKQALETITPADIRGWFQSCGYPVH